MEYVFLEPWLAADNSPTVVAELQKEINQHHPLFGQSVELIGRSLQVDDYLFKVANSNYKYCVVHLIWTGRKETGLSFPTVAFYQSWEAFREEVMKPLHQDYLE